jgi:Fe-S cluster assembly iron-binding protein IscA
MLNLSPLAAEKLSDIRTEEGVPEDLTLRLTRSPSPESDELLLHFVDTPADDDQIGEAHGVTYCVSSEVAEPLENTTLDVQETQAGAGFVLRSS